VEFEWDERKRQINLRKHGIDFVGCATVFDGLTATVIDDRFDYGERRLVTYGLLDDRVVAVVHAETAEVIRIISIRKATQREQTFYFQSIAN
jgi:uncharacterized DUF497 family protein